MTRDVTGLFLRLDPDRVRVSAYYRDENGEERHEDFDAPSKKATIQDIIVEAHRRIYQ